MDTSLGEVENLAIRLFGGIDQGALLVSLLPSCMGDFSYKPLVTLDSAHTPPASSFSGTVELKYQSMIRDSAMVARSLNSFNTLR